MGVNLKIKSESKDENKSIEDIQDLVFTHFIPKLEFEELKAKQYELESVIKSLRIHEKKMFKLDEKTNELHEQSTKFSSEIDKLSIKTDNVFSSFITIIISLVSVSFILITVYSFVNVLMDSMLSKYTITLHQAVYFYPTMLLTSLVVLEILIYFLYICLNRFILKDSTEINLWKNPASYIIITTAGLALLLSLLMLWC